MGTDKPTPKAPSYAWIVPHVSQVARQCGYAIGLHGSMNRDLDLIAAPWTESAVSAAELVESIRAAVDGRIDTFAHDPRPEHDDIRTQPTKKPHGRLAWSIYFCGRAFYIDLSVMPRIAMPPHEPAPINLAAATTEAIDADNAQPENIMGLAEILAIIAAFSVTAAKMEQEGRKQTTAEEQAALDNVWSRKGAEDARFDAPAAGTGATEAGT